MKKLVFTGCSYTSGAGWNDIEPSESLRTDCKDSPYLWTNLCHKNIAQLANLELVNFGKTGASNTDIFEATVNAIGTYGDSIDTIFCQWTSMPRYNFNSGFELWDTSENITANSTRTHAINVNRTNQWTREYVNDICNRLYTIHHLHWEILKVIRYTTIISNLAKKTKIKNLFFINGICPWDNNYFVKLDNVLPESYTTFTKKSILDIDNRSDEDIYKLYNLAHLHYQEAGGINQTQWINLYESFSNNKIDVNFDRQHPGKKSNELYCSMVKQSLEHLI